MMMKKIIIFALMIGQVVMGLAQRGTLTGRVVDPEKQQPVAYASVGLLKSADSSVVNTQMTDKDGVFAFDGLVSGKYFVKIYYVGYREYVSEEIEVGKADFDMGTIVLGELVEMLEKIEVV